MGKLGLGGAGKGLVLEQAGWPLAPTPGSCGLLPRLGFCLGPVGSLVTAPWPHSGSCGRGLCERVLRCVLCAHGGRGAEARPTALGRRTGPARKHSLSFFLTFCPRCSHGPLQGTPLRVVGGWGGSTVGPHPGTPAPHTPSLSSAQRLTPRRGGWLGSGSPQQARPTQPGTGLQGLGLLVTLRGPRPEPHPRVSW